MSFALFSGIDASGGYSLWVTDGTAAGTQEIEDFGSPYSPSDFTVFGNEVLFSDGVNLWVTDGTAAGTYELTGISGTSSYGFDPGDFTVFGNEVLFSGTDVYNDTGLWITDGTAAGSRELASFGPYFNNQYLQIPYDQTVFNNEVIFIAGRNLWVTDGTAAGTHEFISGSPGSFVYDTYQMVVFNNEVLFIGSDGSGNTASLWVTDGTAAGTHPLNVSINNPKDLTAFGNEMLLSDGTNLWVTDGTAAGTHEVSGINGIWSGGLQPAGFTVFPPTGEPPIVTGQSSVTYKPNQSIALASLIGASDLGGTIASYVFYDSTPGAGYLTLDGQRIDGTSVSVSSDQLGRVGYSTGPSAGSNQIAIDAIDNQGVSSSDFLMTINVSTGASDVPPILTGQSSVSYAQNTSFNFTSLIQATDPDGTVAAYEFWDSTPGAGYLTFNGQRIIGPCILVSAAQLGQVGYFTGSNGGSNQIAIDAIDDQGVLSSDFLMTINVAGPVDLPLQLSDDLLHAVHCPSSLAPTLHTNQ